MFGIAILYSLIVFFIYILEEYCPEIYGLCVTGNVLNIIIITSVIVYYLYICFAIFISQNKKFNVDKEMWPSENKWCCIHIPYYNEDKDVIQQSIDSIVESDYSKKILIITLDGTKNDDILKIVDNIEYKLGYEKKTYNGGIKIYEGIYKNVPYIILDKPVRTGKRDCQKIIFSLLSWSRGQDTQQDSLNESLNRKMMKLGTNLQETKYLAMIDGDTKIEKTSLSTMINYLETNENYIGVCGETTVNTICKSSIWTIVQNVEYYLTHKFIKLIENTLGNVFVLSGCFCVLKIDSMKDELIIDNTIIDKYTKKTDNDLHKMNLLNIGEDRYLSSLLLISNKGQLRYIEDAKCETICPTGFYSLLVQRRRWTNSLLHCLIDLIMKSKNKTIKFVAIIELLIVITMPIIYIVGFFYIMENILFSVLINAFPLIIIIFLRDYKLILQYFLFLLFQIVFMVIIPIYSFINQDNTNW